MWSLTSNCMMMLATSVSKSWLARQFPFGKNLSCIRSLVLTTHSHHSHEDTHSRRDKYPNDQLIDPEASKCVYHCTRARKKGRSLGCKYRHAYSDLLHKIISKTRQLFGVRKKILNHDIGEESQNLIGNGNCKPGILLTRFPKVQPVCRTVVIQQNNCCSWDNENDVTMYRHA